MDLVQLYQQTPVARHPEIIVSNDRVFFDDEEYIIHQPDWEFKLIRSEKNLVQRLTVIGAKLDAIKPSPIS